MRAKGLEPPWLAPHGPKPCACTNSATPAGRDKYRTRVLLKLRGLTNELAHEIVAIFEDAAFSLGPEVAVLTEREFENRGPEPYLRFEMTPLNPRAARVGAVLAGELMFSIGSPGCGIDFGDIFEPVGAADAETAAVETTRHIVAAAVNGEYYERIQQFPVIGVTAATGFLALGDRKIAFGHGLTMPFLKTVVQTYEPYRLPRKGLW
jgi:hypothetical protein